MLPLLLPDKKHQTIAWGKLYGCASALSIAEAAKVHSGPIVYIAKDTLDADRKSQELRFFAPELPVTYLPDWETLPYDLFSPHQDVISQRLVALYTLPRQTKGIVILNINTLLQRYAPQDFVEQGTLIIQVGETQSIDELRGRLQSAGYVSVPQVTEHGEYAVRGSILDVFPMGSQTPYRVDFFDEEIETIRTFNPENQLSIEKLGRVEMLPAREFPFDNPAIRQFRQRYRGRFEGDPTGSQVYTDVTEGIAFGGIEYYIPLFFDETTSITDYFPDNALILLPKDWSTSLEQIWLDIHDRFEQYAHDVQRPILKPEEIAFEPELIDQKIDKFGRVFISDFELEPNSQTTAFLNYPTKAPPDLKLDSRAKEPAARLLEYLANYTGRILFAAESAGRRETLLDLLRGHQIGVAVVQDWREFIDGSQRIGITVAPLEQGLSLEDDRFLIIAEEQLFGDRVRQRRRRRATKDPEAVIRNLTDLSVGAPVVHDQYGVGRYQGLTVLEIGGITTEFLELWYAGDDKLYVPVHALHLITRYTGTSADKAPLHKLGGDQWQKAKRKAAEKIRDTAVELLDVYARRAAKVGHAYSPDMQDYVSFSDQFAFEPTADQEQAFENILADMRDQRPMDRVICGDVGFGKTEVALRATFTAAIDGKQVAILVPTTLLAQQHYQTFVDRFADWPVRVEVLSRFRSKKQTDEVLSGLETGTVDVVVGTHKLLQDSVSFKNLGLIIIDEEHRFGVRHKERLKKLRSEVDILTLTATPIPRTLNMALGGLRELSLIATPPTDRLAVKTFVSEWNDAMIREACIREIRRGGQVYFVHNEVKTIEKIAQQVTKLVPEAKLQVAHGQMRERELEQIMLDFYHRRFNLLLCTTIIESGLDVPTANTIVINKADHFGLAQLHQLRGRVGRSHHRAYAYLITPPSALMTSDAKKRLAAIESMEELGAGFTLATHDLEIRGAGELLGEEQSGQIQEIGFTMYMELLERAVKDLKEGKEPDLEQPLDHGVDIELNIPALLPDDYMPDIHLRLILYKRIANAESEDALRELQVEMIDRFGLLPDPAKTLFSYGRLRQMANGLGIKSIKANTTGGKILFQGDTKVNAEELVRMIQSQPGKYRLEGQDSLRFTLSKPEPEKRVEQIERLLVKLS